MKTQIIAVANQKGGTSKTTTSNTLAYEFLNKGKKVLLIDFDPQGTLTNFFNLEPLQFQDSENNIANIFKKNKSATPLKISEYLDFIPSSGKELTEVGESNIAAKELKLKNYLKNIASSYDIVLIDTNPTFGSLTINSLLACDTIIVPVKTASPDESGLVRFFNDLEDLYIEYNRDKINIFIIPTMYNKTRTDDKEVLNTLHNNLPLHIKNTYKVLSDSNLEICEPIPERSSFSAAYGVRMPVRQYILNHNRHHIDAIEIYESISTKIVNDA